MPTEEFMTQMQEIIQPEPDINWWRAALFTLGWGAAGAAAAYMIPTRVQSTPESPNAHLTAMVATGAVTVAAAYAVGIIAAKKNWV